MKATVNGVEYTVENVGMIVFRPIREISALMTKQPGGLDAEEIIADSEKMDKLTTYVIDKCVSPKPPSDSVKLRLIAIISKELNESFSMATKEAKK